MEAPWQAKPYVRPKLQRSLVSFYTGTAEDAAEAAGRVWGAHRGGPVKCDSLGIRADTDTAARPPRATATPHPHTSPLVTWYNATAVHVIRR